MNGKQNFIFFIGLALIVVNWHYGGQFKTLANGLFGGAANAGGPSAAQVKQEFSTPLGPLPIANFHTTPDLPSTPLPKPGTNVT